MMNVMRELGIRGVRRGRTPVTTKPARGTGGRPDLVERRFEAEAPNRLHVADITYVRMANGSSGQVVPEKLRTLDHGRPWSDDQFASTRLSSNRDMSR